MNIRTNPYAIRLRSIARALGINRALSALMLSDRYEERFDDAMMNSLREGDVAWDVGANIGFYTQKFAEKVGITGTVLAFEPSSITREQLVGNVAQIKNVEIVPLALGKSDGAMTLVQSDDREGANSRLSDTAGQRGEEIQIASVDSYLEQHPEKVPNFIKIDTEGFEIDILKGMSGALLNEKIRCLCIEVHFGLLAKRGLSDAPREIEHMLTESGFDARWTDYSHIIATRK